MTTLLLLFYEFFKTGLFAVGGGLATLPFLYDMAASHPNWFTTQMLADMIAVSESTPGPIGINMATYAGFNTAGIPGAIIATVALVTPSIVIIIIVAQFMKRFSENFYVKSGFYGLRPAVTALISVAAFEVVKVSLLTLDKFEAAPGFLTLFDYKAVILFAVLMFGYQKFKKHPIIYIAIAAAAGIVFKF